MIPSSVSTRLAVAAASTKCSGGASSRFVSVLAGHGTPTALPSTGGTPHNRSNSSSLVRWKSSSSSSGGGGGGNKPPSSSPSFRPRRAPGKDYYRSHQKQNNLVKPKQVKGPKEPYDVSTPIPRIDLNQIKITNVDADKDEDYELFGPMIGDAIRSLRLQEKRRRQNQPLLDGANEIEAQLRVMDFLTSLPGSTEDLVGSRRAVAMEAYEGEQPDAIMAEIDRLVEQERTDYMELPPTDPISIEDIQKADNSGSSQIPLNQLAHGEWGELLVRTDRVCKMWRGGRIESYRALVVGGNLRGCGGFGVGKAFEPEDAVEIACRMAKRNIFFVDRYRGRGLTRDLVGRQNSCKVVLRSTDNGLRGNPLSCEILKLMGITDVVAKAHGSRNHYNVVRATYKALLTHESLDEISLKRGVRLINLQKAKRLGI